MKVLFFVRHLTYLRNFESVLRMLAEQGHQVHVAAERDEAFGGREMIDRLIAAHPGLTAGEAPERADGWYAFATKVRLSLDYLRYLDPAYDATPKLRARAEERVPDLLLKLSRLPGFSGRGGRRRLARLLTGIEHAIPGDPAIADYIRDHRPDVVLITPLIGVVASPQLDYLYTAMSLNIPTALCVWSWDHLSSKALIRTVPDRVFVWNGTQQREAVALHGVDPDRVIVTGAQCFDQWFDREPRRDRAEFCRHVGLPDDRQYILWVCSALFRGSPVEAEFVVRWIRALRDSGQARLRDANILVRPHPSRLKEWERIDVRAIPGVAFWGGNPVDADARADYYDSLHHSACVAGLNTSAFIEGAIAGRAAFTVLLPEFHENQEGTIHFHYLLDEREGLLHASRSLEAHAQQLEACLAAGDVNSTRSRRFVEAFVRPHGLSAASTPVFVRSVCELSGLRPRHRAVAASMAAVSGARVLARFSEGMGRRLMMSERDRLEYERSRDAAQVKNQDRSVRLKAKDQVRAEKARRVAEREQEKRRRKRQQERNRLKKLFRRGLRLG